MRILVDKIKEIEGFDISVITVENYNNHSIKLMDYGATILELNVPDREGKAENIVLTYMNLKDYINCSTYFGMTCGRTSGRILNGIFTIGGNEYYLNKNEKGLNNLHGGLNSFSYKKWDFETFEREQEVGVKFFLNSPNMEEGYPGNVNIEVIYTLNDKNEVVIEYRGKTDKTTLLNMTNHSYFNLSGDYKRPVTDQYLYVDADRFIELDDELIGIDIKNAKGTPMEFTTIKAIGRDINDPYLKNHTANGYDHPWLLNYRDINRTQVVLSDKASGRIMKVKTTYPSIVIYSYNYPNNEVLKGGIMAKIHDAICLETQYEPNGINHFGLNDSVLNPEDEYHEKTIFKFEVEI